MNSKEVIAIAVIIIGVTMIACVGMLTDHYAEQRVHEYEMKKLDVEHSRLHNTGDANARLSK